MKLFLVILLSAVFPLLGIFLVLYIRKYFKKAV